MARAVVVEGIVTSELDVRGLSLTQPWAQLVAIDAKRFETRHPRFGRSYTGPVLIHAAKGWRVSDREMLWRSPFREALCAAGVRTCPRGVVLAAAELAGCYRFGPDDPQPHFGIDPAPHEAAFGNYTPGRVGLALRNVRPLERPIEAKGALGLWRVPPEVLDAVRSQLPGWPAAGEVQL